MKNIRKKISKFETLIFFWRLGHGWSDGPRLIQFQVKQFQTYAILKKIKHIKKKTCLKGVPIFFFRAGMKGQWDEDGWRIMLGNNTVDGVVMLRPITFQGAGYWISTGLSRVYIRSTVQKFPAWHTKATPNGKCCEGYIVPSMVRLMYQLKSVLK